MGKKNSLPYQVSSPRQTRSQSADYPTSAKAAERCHSLPPSSAPPEDDLDGGSGGSSPGRPIVRLLDEAGQPSDVQTGVNSPPRPIPVYQGDRTPTKGRGRPRSMQLGDVPSRSVSQSSPHSPHYYPAYQGYAPSPMHPPSPLPILLLPPVWPAPSSAHGSPGAYHNPVYAQHPSANHGDSYSNALNLQGVPQLSSHASYTPPPPPYWPYPSHGYVSAHGSPNGGSPLNGHFPPSVDAGRGGYPPRRFS